MRLQNNFYRFCYNQVDGINWLKKDENNIAICVKDIKDKREVQDCKSSFDVIKFYTGYSNAKLYYRYGLEWQYT